MTCPNLYKIALAVGLVLASSASAGSVQEDLANLRSADPYVRSATRMSFGHIVDGLTAEGRLHKQFGIDASPTAICLANTFAGLNMAAVVEIAEASLRGAIAKGPGLAKEPTALILWLELSARYCSKH